MKWTADDVGAATTPKIKHRTNEPAQLSTLTNRYSGAAWAARALEVDVDGTRAATAFAVVDAIDFEKWRTP